ncbi:MAG: V-type ATPase 116kDa subunit family protein [Candidatus Thorarchaeota archaeon]|nr:V-type ATPase 116kDa subunit family protein [Candidatus Thorarchaeota archaeon]
MRLSMSPSKMLVAKVVTHKDYERQMILALEEFGLFEPIDVRHQAGILEGTRTRDEETVFAVSERFSVVIESLGLETFRGIGKRTEVEDKLVADSLAHVSEVIQSVETEVLETDQEIATLSLELERQKGVRDIALALEPLGLDLEMITTTEYTYTTAGKIQTGHLSKLEWSLNELTEGMFVFRAVPAPKSKGTSIASVSISLERKNAADRIFTAIGFETFTIPEGYPGSPEEIADAASEEIIKLEKSLDQLLARKESIAQEWKPRILAAWEILEIEKSRISVKGYFVYTESSVKAWGWIPEGTQDKIEVLLNEMIGTAFNIAFDQPDFAEHDSPTYLSNPSIMKPTEDVVSAYGTPSKHDLDPTKIMWISFPLIFGLVFADVGQGLLILFIGLAAIRATRKGDDWGQIMGYVQNGGKGLVMMGLFAILGGFLFGSFFGSETVIEPLWPMFAHYIDGEVNPSRASHMLKLSIEIGVIQISLGIILDIYNKLKHKEWDEGIISIAFLWMYLGFINLVFGVSYNNINTWFSSEGAVNLWLPIVGIGYGTGNNGVYPVIPIAPMLFTIIAFVIPMILMAVLAFRHGMDGAVHFMESVLSMISHTVSYARIFALNTVHVILSGVFFSFTTGLLMIYFPPISLGGVVIIPEAFNHHGATILPGMSLVGAAVGSFLVGILEGLLAFMHTLRLHFVEFFSKFYHAGGTPFTPFVTKRVFTVEPTRVAMAVVPSQK